MRSLIGTCTGCAGGSNSDPDIIEGRPEFGRARLAREDGVARNMRTGPKDETSKAERNGETTETRGRYFWERAKARYGKARLNRKEGKARLPEQDRPEGPESQRRAERREFQESMKNET
jgi:hypothetical protein